MVVRKNLPLHSSSMSQLAWHCSWCVMDTHCSIFNYFLRIILIFPSRYSVFLSYYLWLKLYYSPDSKLWRKRFYRTFVWRQFVSFKNSFDRGQRSRHSLGIYILVWSILEVLSYLMLNLLFISQCYKSYSGRWPYLRFYPWNDDPAYNVLD